MKILRSGHKKIKTQPFRGHCNNCGAVVRARRYELRVEYDSREQGEFGRGTCPQCKYEMIFYPKAGT
jgi:ribosomal protein S27E